MVITLIEQTYPIRRTLMGGDSVEAGANTVIKFHVGNGIILDQKVPAGKVWRLYVTVKVEEANA